MTSGLQTDSESSGSEEDREPVGQQEEPGKSASVASSRKENPQQPIEIIDENLSDVETPRADVSALKIDSAQKEKNSFLQDLKKQSFLISEDST